MIAELKLTFQNRPDNLLQIIQQGYQNQNLTLTAIINNTIYQNNPIYHNCFVHGFQATDAILLFQIIGNDLLIHIEIPPTNNLFVSLRAKVSEYYRNIIGILRNNNVSIDNINQEVMITSENSYILVGKINDRKKEFKKRLNKDKYKLFIAPTILLLLTLIAKYFKFIDKIETVIVGFVSVVIGLLVWYILDYYMIDIDDNFRFEPINE